MLPTFIVSDFLTLFKVIRNDKAKLLKKSMDDKYDGILQFIDFLVLLMTRNNWCHNPHLRCSIIELFIFFLPDEENSRYRGRRNHFYEM